MRGKNNDVLGRAGGHGENENYALEKNVVVVGWEGIGDLSVVKDRDALQQLVAETWPDESIGTVRVWTGELWAFKEKLQKDDWVALPLKSRSAIAVGRIVGPYKFVSDAPPGAKHQRLVNGFAQICRAPKSIKIFFIL
jgi:restriction system protein